MESDEILLVNAKVGDLAKSLAYHLGIALTNNEDCVDDDPKKNVKKHYVYGYQGLCDLLSVGKTTVYKLLKSGAITPAIRQRGKILVVDSDMALELLDRGKKNNKKKRR